MKKPYNKNGVEILKGDILTSEECGNIEEGVVVGVNYDKKEIYVYADDEGWDMSDEYDNFGDIVWR
jgi:hypothetical protein